MTATEPARDLLLDLFGRVRELVEEIIDGLSPTDATFRPDADANSIGWLVWHLTRIQDDHVAEAADGQQAWFAGGWRERFALPFEARATGFGHSSDEVAATRTDPTMLSAYHADVHEMTTSFVRGLKGDDLARIIDERWDPPVTLGVRLVSVTSDCLQHLGQAAYVRGLIERG